MDGSTTGLGRILIAAVSNKQQDYEKARDKISCGNVKRRSTKRSCLIFKPLTQIVRHEMKSNQVRVIPLEKVILNNNISTED